MGMRGMGVGSRGIRVRMWRIRVGMPGIRMGMRAIRVRMRGIRVGMRGIRVGMWAIRVIMRVYNCLTGIWQRFCYIRYPRYIHKIKEKLILKNTSQQLLPRVAIVSFFSQL